MTDREQFEAFYKSAPCDFYSSTKDNVYQVWQEAKRQAAPKWIRINEGRLPPLNTDEEFLIRDKYSQVFICRYIDIDEETGEKEDFPCFYCDLDRRHVSDAVEWMRIPK